MSSETSPSSPSYLLPISARVALRPSLYLVFNSGVSNILHQVRDQILASVLCFYRLQSAFPVRESGSRPLLVSLRIMLYLPFPPETLLHPVYNVLPNNKFNSWELAHYPNRSLFLDPLKFGPNE